MSHLLRTLLFSLLVFTVQAAEESPARPNLFEAIGKLLKAEPKPTADLSPGQSAAASGEVANSSRNLHVTPSAGRVALVIGNAAYPGIAALKNPANDANDIAAKLKTLGFDVTLKTDIPLRQMLRTLTEFGDKVKQDTEVLFFYAGHGMQVKGRNYLIPIDAQIGTESSVSSEAVDVDQLLDKLAPARLSMVILDACRNNPFERSFRGGGQGLAQINAPTGTLIAYATAPGKVAADGEGRNGLYTQELLKAIDVPGIKVEDVFKRVRANVITRSGEAQTPWESSSLTGDFYFIFRGPATVNVQQVPTDPGNEAALWAEVKQDGTREYFEAYLKQYPKGKFAGLAKVELKKIDDKKKAERAKEEAEQKTAVEREKQDTTRNEREKNRFAALRMELVELISSQPRIYSGQTLPKTISDIPILYGPTAQNLKGQATGTQIKELLTVYQRDAEAGDPVAQYSLGSMYAFGLGVQQSDTESSKWQNKAAVAGLPIAQTSLGVQYLNIEKDNAEAAKWFRRAAEQGEAIAQNNLGTAYSHGQGVAKDDAEAVRWYRKSAEQGFSGAQYNLGIAYENGQGATKDEAEAVRLYRKSAEQGNVLAQSSLAFMCMTGKGIPKDEGEGVLWYRKAAEQGDVSSQNNLGVAYANGYGVAKDEGEAVRWYRMAAEQGNISAQNNLGTMYENGRGISKDKAEAVRWYRKAAEQGDLYAIRNLERLK